MKLSNQRESLFYIFTFLVRSSSLANVVPILKASEPWVRVLEFSPSLRFVALARFFHLGRNSLSSDFQAVKIPPLSMLIVDLGFLL